MQFLKCAIAILLAAPIFGSGGLPEVPKIVTVHEWGTFTTVASETGGSEPWSPLGAPSDLPCFVMHLNGLQYKVITPRPAGPVTRPVTVRMETPVLYFYSPAKTKVSVSVDFPHGLITEWFPPASRVAPVADRVMPAVENGHIEWDQLEIVPGDTPAFPKGEGPSPYYAARETDSDPVRIGSMQEKLVFYRGIANFPVPLSARVSGDGSVEVRNTGSAPLPLAVLFENRGGRVGYRMVHAVRDAVGLSAPELTGSLASLKQELADALTGQGLYRKEADAMVATWSDSWFEEGMRVFYLVPREVVDRELPLTVAPAPKVIDRVFVGRVELLSPYLRDRLATALAAGDIPALDGFGRFLAPFMRQVNVNAAPAVASFLDAKAKFAEQEFLHPSCVQ